MKYCPLCEERFPDTQSTCPHDGVQLVVSYEWPPETVIKGKYRVLAKLGQGGMGIVYKAQHLFMNEPRALKVMSPELARDPSFLRRFRQEAQSASRLKHPNIVHVNDLDQAEDGSLFMAMEYVEGASLRKVLQDAGGPLPVARALNIARGMAEALGFAHAHGMVHRDIKPDNVLIASDMQGREIAKVLDFGIVAMRESSSKLSSMVIQTDMYASPEQWMGMKSDEIDGRADLYALGMTLYEMLAGRVPFDAHTRHGWMRAHLDEQPAPPSQFNPALPPVVDELVLHLLAKNRDERTPAAAAFLEELRQVEAEPASGAAPQFAPTVAPTAPPRTPPPSRIATPPKTPTPPRPEAKEPQTPAPPPTPPPKTPTPPPKTPPPKAPTPPKPPAQESVPLTIPPKRQEEPPAEDLYAEPEADEVVEEPVVVEAPPEIPQRKTRAPVDKERAAAEPFAELIGASPEGIQWNRVAALALALVLPLAFFTSFGEKFVWAGKEFDSLREALLKLIYRFGGLQVYFDYVYFSRQSFLVSTFRLETLLLHYVAPFGLAIACVFSFKRIRNTWLAAVLAAMAFAVVMRPIQTHSINPELWLSRMLFFNFAWVFLLLAGAVVGTRKAKRRFLGLLCGALCSALFLSAIPMGITQMEEYIPEKAIEGLRGLAILTVGVAAVFAFVLRLSMSVMRVPAELWTGEAIAKPVKAATPSGSPRTVPPARRTPEGPGVHSRVEPPKAPTPPKPPAQESVPLTIPPRKQQEAPPAETYVAPAGEREVVQVPSKAAIGAPRDYAAQPAAPKARGKLWVGIAVVALLALAGIYLWNATRSQAIDYVLDRTLTGHTNFVESVAFSPDGRWLASGSWDNTIKLWDVASGQNIRTLTDHTYFVTSVAFSPDGRWLASGSSDQTIKLWDVASGQSLRTLTGHASSVLEVAFSPDGRWLASGNYDKTVKLWDVATGREVRTLTGHTREVTNVVFSPDGRWLASGSDDITIKLWDVATGQNIRTVTGHTSEVNSVAFSPDGRWLASGSSDTTIKLWDVASGQNIRTLTDHTSIVNDVAFSPDGRWLASGSWDHSIKLWNVASGQNVRTLTGHTRAVTSVAFSPDGRWLASGSLDKTIQLWRRVE
jgi:serine/threonine protein kinase/sugar lactone lactonase YvrE